MVVAGATVAGCQFVFVFFFVFVFVFALHLLSSEGLAVEVVVSGSSGS